MVKTGCSFAKVYSLLVMSQVLARRMVLAPVLAQNASDVVFEFRLDFYEGRVERPMTQGTDFGRGHCWKEYRKVFSRRRLPKSRAALRKSGSLDRKGFSGQV